MPQTPAPTRANVRQSATWRISDTNLSPPCQLTTHAADSMLFLSKSRLFGFLPTKFPEYPYVEGASSTPFRATKLDMRHYRFEPLGSAPVRVSFRYFGEGQSMKLVSS